ncbi:MAG: cobalamin biosynthesis protein CobD [Actinobacteria bacterium]|nr:cobalamin biosynthesis protein CobD [Actinomycetota bacterium]
MVQVLRRRAGGVALGLLWDRLVPEPPDAFHPVARFGSLMAELERRRYADRRSRGVAHAVAGLAVGAAAGTLVPTAVAVGVVAAPRMLGSTAREIGDLLVAGDLDGARQALPGLVGRDPSTLDEGGIARAVVESVAENAVDAFAAPVFWALVGGRAAATAHRAVNTLDAMVGHRSARYERFGWASARLDDVAAWVPARLVVLGVVVLRPRRAGAILRAVRTQAPAHPSPNAGVAEAAFAAALGVRLGGELRYGDRVEVRPTLGEGDPPTAADVARAVRLLDELVLLTALCSAGAASVAAGRRRRRSRRVSAARPG